MSALIALGNIHQRQPQKSAPIGAEQNWTKMTLHTNVMETIQWNRGQRSSRIAEEVLHAVAEWAWANARTLDDDTQVITLHDLVEAIEERDE